ncbi:hypothetical protein P3T73_07780 [Kiritimatiellota bacterium B12222]|nr:hypothetical protein P3T73_07780 [Kiritimatiellota bacterium B12222]
MNKINLSKSFCACLVLMPLLAGGVASGAPLVYEGFNYGGSSGAMDGITTNALGLTGDYATSTGTSGNGNVQTATYNSTSLSFTGYQSSGGSLTMSLAPEIDNTKEYVLTSVGFDSTATGDIYHSFLANIGANTMSNGSAGTEIRSQTTSNVNSSATKVGASMTVAPNRAGSSGNRPSVGYEADTSSGNGLVDVGSTYLYISKFTNVGGVGGTASLWVFDNAGFVAWQNGGGLEADMGTHASFTSTDTRAAANILFNSNNSMRLSATEFSLNYNTGASNYSLSGELTTTYDEIRYGTSLNDVIAIPEASTGALVILGMMAFFGLSRKKK